MGWGLVALSLLPPRAVWICLLVSWHNSLGQRKPIPELLPRKHRLLVALGLGLGSASWNKALSHQGHMVALLRTKDLCFWGQPSASE